METANGRVRARRHHDAMRVAGGLDDGLRAAPPGMDRGLVGLGCDRRGSARRTQRLARALSGMASAQPKTEPIERTARAVAQHSRKVASSAAETKQAAAAIEE